MNRLPDWRVASQIRLVRGVLEGSVVRLTISDRVGPVTSVSYPTAMTGYFLGASMGS